MRRVQVEIPVGLGPALRCASLAFARTHGWLIGALTLVALGSGLLGFVVAAHGVALLALGMTATVVHEFGHLIAYRVAAPNRGAVLDCDGLLAALHRAPLTRRADRAVTAAGPLAPLSLAAVLVPLGGVLPAEAVGAVLIAGSHAMSLALPTADRLAWRQAGERPTPHGGESPTLLA